MDAHDLHRGENNKESAGGFRQKMLRMIGGGEEGGA